MTTNSWGKGWTADEVAEFVENTYSRDVILDVFMGFAGAYMGRRCILIVGSNSLHAHWIQDWPELTDLALELVRSARAAYSPDAKIVRAGLQVGTAGELGVTEIFQTLEIPEPQTLASVAIPISGRTAISLLGEPAVPNIASTDLESLGERVGEQLERVIKLAKAGNLPPEAARVPDPPARFKEDQRESSEAPHMMPGSAESAASASESSVVDGTQERRRPAIGELLRSTREMDVLDMDEARPTIEAPKITKEQANASSTMFGLPLATKKFDIHDVGLFESNDEAPAIKPDFDDQGTVKAEVPAEFRHDSEGTVKAQVPAEFRHDSEGTVKAQVPESLKEFDSEAREETKLVNESVAKELLDASGAESGDKPKTGEVLEISGLAEESTPPDFAAPAPSKSQVRSEVEVVTPKSLGDETSNKTLVGGIEAQASFLSRKVEPQKRVDDAPPALGAPVGGSTIPGGIEAFKSEAAESPIPETKRGVPMAGILKPAKFTRRRTRTPAPTVGSATMQAPKPQPAHDDDDKEEDLKAESSLHTMMGMSDSWPDQSQEEKSGPVHDAWFDYFAEELETRDKEQAQSDADDPLTIPPEALERLLESGPIALDLQESFLLMDSRDPRVAFDAAHEIAEAGEEVIDVLVEMFPGRLWVDRYQFTPETLPPVSEHGPVLAALVRIGEPSLIVVARYINSTSIEQRFYATMLLKALPADGLLDALFLRLFDRDKQTRTIARHIILQYTDAPNFKSAVRAKLLHTLEMDQDDLKVEVAADILSRLREVEAVPLLIELLGRHAEHTNRVVMTSLQNITLHQHSAPFEWKQWWAEAKDSERSTWIVKAMDSPHDQIRHLVYEEIQRIPGLEISYHPDQPSKLRQRAQKLLEQWFAQRS